MRTIAVVLWIIVLMIPAKLFAGEVSCNVEAYVNDPDPKGANVRVEPNKNAKVIKKLKKDTMIAISKFKDGWLYVDRVDAEPETWKKYAVKGWVVARLLGTSARHVDKIATKEGRGAHVYAKPNRKSKIMGGFEAESELLLLSCRGKWVEVQGPGIKKKLLRGWVAPESYCSNPYTTCP